jgi:hypothetical protein
VGVKRPGRGFEHQSHVACYGKIFCIEKFSAVSRNKTVSGTGNEMYEEFCGWWQQSLNSKYANMLNLNLL